MRERGDPALAKGVSRALLCTRRIGRAFAEILPQRTFGTAAEARSPADLGGHAGFMLGPVEREALGSGNLMKIAPRLQPVARGADRRQPLRVVRIVVGTSEGQGWVVIEDDSTSSRVPQSA
jgi:hypothetical protein